MDPVRPGLQLHRIEEARDRNFWSIRVSRDIRIIVHRTQDRLMLCYVDHHDDAYRWAERRKLETHPRQALHNWSKCERLSRRFPSPYTFR